MEGQKESSVIWDLDSHTPVLLVCWNWHSVLFIGGL